jgi:hypothetical protein
MSKWRALPTWVMFRISRPLLPKWHPWRHRPFTLQDWYHGETELCKAFDRTGWIIYACWCVLTFYFGWGWFQ